MSSQIKFRVLKCLLVFLLFGAVAGTVIWRRVFRAIPPMPIANDGDWFKYGSLGNEAKMGIPYWIWVVMPRIFPDLMPGPGGYSSFGIVWEEGHEMPVGFTKETIGFPRVGNNCALCHVSTYRVSEESKPIVVLGAPAHRFNPQALFRFFAAAANDSRFNAANFLTEIKRETSLDALDRLLYRFAIIPMTRKALIAQGEQLAWMNQPGKPDWGPGRDDAFNLPKFMLAHLPDDGTVGQCDFGSTWNLRVRTSTNHLLMNWSGESPSLQTVLVDSAVGLGPKPGAHFDNDIKRLETFMMALPAPRYPFPIDAGVAATGRPIYASQCSQCHDIGAPRTSRVIPLEEIGTDRERSLAWTQTAAEKSNEAVRKLGFSRPDLVKNSGYLSPPLDGIWMRAPYLHNGSAPTLRDLLEPVEKRPAVFYRGYDVYDPINIGFVTQGSEATRTGWKQDAKERGNSNGGHIYGTNLSQEDKQALLEYLKTL